VLITNFTDIFLPVFIYNGGNTMSSSKYNFKEIEKKWRDNWAVNPVNPQDE
jgi:hypothetical protein